MRVTATQHAALMAAIRRTAVLCALVFAAHLGSAAPAIAQSSWATVVAPAEPAAPAGKPATKAAAAAKRSVRAKAPAAPVTTTGSIKPTVEPAAETLAGQTRVAAQGPAEAGQPHPQTQDHPAPQEKAAPRDKAASQPETESSRPAPEAPAFSTSAARQFCINITDAAADARVAWQKKMLLDIAQDVDKRVALLEEKTAEYQRWVTRRDEFVQKARDSLVLIYSRMRPDAAALQLVAMDEETAAAVLLRLDPRAASIILNEMEPGKAARLTATINGAAKDMPAAPAKGNAGGGKS